VSARVRERSATCTFLRMRRLIQPVTHEICFVIINALRAWVDDYTRVEFNYDITTRYPFLEIR